MLSECWLGCVDLVVSTFIFLGLESWRLSYLARLLFKCTRKKGASFKRPQAMLPRRSLWLWLALIFIGLCARSVNGIRKISGIYSGGDCYCVTDEDEGTSDPDLLVCRLCFREGQLFDDWNWTMARTKCQERGLDLVILTSQEYTDRIVKLITDADMAKNFNWEKVEGTTQRGPYAWTGAVASRVTGQSAEDREWTWLEDEPIDHLWHPVQGGRDMAGQTPDGGHDLVLGAREWRTGEADLIKSYIWGYICGSPPPEDEDLNGHGKGNDQAKKGEQNQEKGTGDSNVAGIVGGVVGVGVLAVVGLVLTVFIIS